MLRDFERGEGRLQITHVDPTAFRVGENISTTPGKVVYQTDLMQLIQYDPATDNVYKRPLRIAPPWINKFYILDLRPENSLIKWCTEQGYTVFVMSWVNPDSELAGKRFEDYMLEGPLAALDAIERATGEHEVTALGYCVGGTLMASTRPTWPRRTRSASRPAPSWRRRSTSLKRVTWRRSSMRTRLRILEQEMDESGGVLDASVMFNTFNALRANALVWSFVINNYLLGKDPLPFDLLYWNSDATRMPAAMQSWYLRKMYQESLLSQPGALELGGGGA